MKSINNTYRIFALIMAFLMFSTTVNLAIDMHYCQGQLKSVSFFGKAENCHEIMATMINCPHHQKMVEKASTKEGCSMDKKDCCDNKFLHIQSDLDQLNYSYDLETNQKLQQFVIAFVNVFYANKFIEKSIPNFKYYHPPIVVKDLPVLNQSFLL